MVWVATLEKSSDESIVEKKTIKGYVVKQGLSNLFS